MKKNKYDYSKGYNEEYDKYIENNKDNTEEENDYYDIETNKLKKFIYNYRNDKKYKAKVQLTGYLVFIIILIVFLNISNMGNNYNYNSNTTNNTTSPNIETTTDEKDNSSLLKKINNNYTYSIDISLKRLKDDNTNEDLTINYNGKSSDENIIINKSTNNVTSTFYKAGDEYYKKNNEEYELMAENEIYDIISSKYIEFSSLKKYIDKASLDHYTNYSSGKIEYVYNLKVSDIVKSYKKEEKILINITEENDIVTIDIDYTNLFKILNTKISECKIKYNYSDIEKTEKIIIFEGKKQNETTTEN